MSDVNKMLFIFFPIVKIYENSTFELKPVNNVNGLQKYILFFYVRELDWYFSKLLLELRIYDNIDFSLRWYRTHVKR